jgi:hypothetical protein
MSYSLSWTTRAEETFNKNIEYLELEWSNSVLNKFLDRVEEVLEKSAKNLIYIRCIILQKIFADV